MIGRSFACLAMIVAGALPCRADPPDTQPHVFRDRSGRTVVRPIDRPTILRPPRAPPLEVEPPDQFQPPPVERPSPLEGDQIQGPGSFSHGFHLTVPLGAPTKQVPSRLNRAFEVGQALGACWLPPVMPWKIITIRLSFKRDGTVNGEPRIAFADAGTSQRNSDLAQSLLAALKHCTPLPFSPSLGSAIAGEIFAISFTHQDQR